jgi:RNA-directed DNA polymerase
MADRVVVLLICVQQNTQGGKDPDRWRFRCAKGGRGEMTKAPISLQDRRRRIYRKAKSDKAHRFWGLFGHVAKRETLAEAYQQAKRNGGAPGLDGQTFGDIEAGGVERFLADIRADL